MALRYLSKDAWSSTYTPLSTVFPKILSKTCRFIETKPKVRRLIGVDRLRDEAATLPKTLPVSFREGNHTLPYRPEAEWMQPAAEIMVREAIGLTEALTKLNVPLTSREAAAFFRSKGFQTLLRQERNRHFAAIGSDPTYAKATAVGQVLFCAQQLIEAGEYDKAAEVILKGAKIAGWLGSETNVNVFAGLSGKELEDVRKKILERRPEPSTTGTIEPLN